LTLNYLSKALLDEHNIRILRLADQEDDIIANVVSSTEDSYFLVDPMVINVAVVPSKADEADEGDEGAPTNYETVLSFSSYVPFAAQNITMSFKREQVELCVPARVDIVKGYIRSIVNLRSQCYGKTSDNNLQ
jgi:hypothetical protein